MITTRGLSRSVSLLKDGECMAAQETHLYLSRTVEPKLFSVSSSKCSITSVAMKLLQSCQTVVVTWAERRTPRNFQGYGYRQTGCLPTDQRGAVPQAD